MLLLQLVDVSSLESRRNHFKLTTLYKIYHAGQFYLKLMRIISIFSKHNLNWNLEQFNLPNWCHKDSFIVFKITTLYMDVQTMLLLTLLTTPMLKLMRIISLFFQAQLELEFRTIQFPIRETR